MILEWVSLRARAGAGGHRRAGVEIREKPVFGNIGMLMGLVNRLQTELPKMRQRLEAARFTGSSAGGEVSATVNGKGQLVEVQISPEAVGEGGTGGEALAEMVKQAVASAQAAAAEAAAAALKELTGGMNIPGLDALLP